MSDDGISMLGAFNSFDVWILGGGGIGFLFVLPLEIACAATMVLVVASLLRLRSEWRVRTEVVKELEALLGERRFEEARLLCEVACTFLTRAVGAGIRHQDRGTEAMVSAARSAADGQTQELQRQVGWLSLLGNFAPLMGLFGTVVGMVMMLGSIAGST